MGRHLRWQWEFRLLGGLAGIYFGERLGQPARLAANRAKRRSGVKEHVQQQAPTKRAAVEQVVIRRVRQLDVICDDALHAFVPPATRNLSDKFLDRTAGEGSFISQDSTPTCEENGFSGGLAKQRAEVLCRLARILQPRRRGSATLCERRIRRNGFEQSAGFLRRACSVLCGSCVSRAGDFGYAHRFGSQADQQGFHLIGILRAHNQLSPGGDDRKDAEQPGDQEGRPRAQPHPQLAAEPW